MRVGNRAVRIALIGLACIVGAAVCLAVWKPGVNTSTPRKAVKSFIRALVTGDADAMHRTAIGTQADFAAARSLADILLAMNRTEEASVRKFGEEGKLSDAKRKFGPFADLDAADERIDGDTASIVDRQDPKDHPVKLKKDANGWKVDLPGTAGSDLANLVRMSANMVAALDKTTQEIDAGKYKTAQEAKAGVNTTISLVALLAAFAHK